jgi:hypothetical protein
MAQLSSILTSAPVAGDTATGVQISTARGELLIDLASTAYSAGEQRYQLWRYDNTATAWFPILVVSMTSKSDPTGKRRVVFDVEGAAYYHLQQLSPSAPAGAVAYLNELGAAGVGGGVRSFFAADLAAASGTSINSTGLAGNSATNNFTGTFSAMPGGVGRNARVAFAASWDGGNVVITGRRRGAVVTETITAQANASVDGTKIFDQIVSAAKTAVGSNSAAATIGVGTKIGLPDDLTAAKVVMTVDDTLATGYTADLTEDAVTPASGDVPNGSKDFLILYR